MRSDSTLHRRRLMSDDFLQTQIQLQSTLILQQYDVASQGLASATEASIAGPANGSSGSIHWTAARAACACRYTHLRNGHASPKIAADLLPPNGAPGCRMLCTTYINYIYKSTRALGVLGVTLQLCCTT